MNTRPLSAVQIMGLFGGVFGGFGIATQDDHQNPAQGQQGRKRQTQTYLFGNEDNAPETCNNGNWQLNHCSLGCW